MNLNNPKIHVTIKDRERIFFDGEVDAVTTYNDLGIFDVLPRHANFISLIHTSIILHDKSKNNQLKIENGLLKVRDDEVNIFLGQ